jgi:hypothetical protein
VSLPCDKCGVRVWCSETVAAGRLDPPGRRVIG